MNAQPDIRDFKEGPAIFNKPGSWETPEVKATFKERLSEIGGDIKDAIMGIFNWEKASTPKMYYPFGVRGETSGPRTIEDSKDNTIYS